MFKVNNKDTRTMPGFDFCELLVALTIVNFEQANAGWELR